MKYLPDTNIFIMAAKGYLPESKFLSGAIKKGQVMISTVVVGEFLAKADTKEEKSFERLLSQFNVIPVNLEVARLAAKYRKEGLKSKRIHMLDCFLAAQAKLDNLILVTNNTADFPMRDVKVTSPSR